jgi:hypothetical protein
LRRFIITALDVVTDEYEFPRKITPLQRSLKSLNEWNNAVAAAVAQHYQRKMGITHAADGIRIMILAANEFSDVSEA